ncbi:MAG: type IV pilin protein [Gammaproteobacteria bacterium]
MKRKIMNMFGFTLIELMITVAIVAILAAIAYPSYTEYVMRGRRADAKAGLLSLQLAQEKYRTNCPRYAAGIDDDPINYSCDAAAPDYTLTHSTSSPDGHYTLSVVSASATTYKIKAARVNGGLQANDKCGDFQIDTSQSSPKQVVNAAGGYDAARCW